MDTDRDGTELQFDTAVPQGGASGAARTLSCGYCARPIAGEYFDVSGRTTCAECRGTIAALMQVPPGAGPFLTAALFGMGAGIAGAAIYYAVIAVTNFEIGIVAILIGYMVGYTVRKGAGGRGGRRFQILAVVLTYLAVGLAYTPLAMKGAWAALQTASAVVVVKAAVLIVIFAFALPVIAVIGSLPAGLLSAAIIFFGLKQAWRMTGRPPLVVTGPYRVGDRAAATP